jgi:UDP-3-O-acyl N-acetylglucosamine deacetylase
VKEKTVAREGFVSGTGLHEGVSCTVTARPAPPRSGVRFFRGGCELKNVSVGGRCTALSNGDIQFKTVEHLLAAVSALGISNVEFHADGPEVPALDGSALPFVRWLKGLGITEQDAEREVFRVTEPIFCGDSRRAICVYPDEVFSVSYVLDYEHPALKSQKVDFKVDAATFEREIAPARTFCTAEEAELLRSKGFGRGATNDNTVVYSAEGAAMPLRFPDEAARHKALDLIGDLALLGFALAGRVIALRGGHELNRKLVEAIRRQKQHGSI